MIGVTHADVCHAGCVGQLDRFSHREVAADLPHGVAAVHDRPRRAFAGNLRLAKRIGAAGFESLDVTAEQFVAVGKRAPTVSKHQFVGDDAGIRVRHASGHQCLHAVCVQGFDRDVDRIAHRLFPRAPGSRLGLGRAPLGLAVSLVPCALGVEIFTGPHRLM